MQKRGNRVPHIDRSILNNSITRNIHTKKKFLGKKAISPLLATVLLIAFAVSIGTLIMNLGKDVIPNSEECTDIKLEIQTASGKPLFCKNQTEGKVYIMIKNTGKVDIKYLKFNIITADFKPNEINEIIIPESGIKKGKTLTTTVDYSKEGDYKAEIEPVITASGAETICSDNRIIVEPLPSCD